MNSSVCSSDFYRGKAVANGVLIVDDEGDMRDTLCEMVKELELHTFAATDHVSAKKTFKRHRHEIGLVLTDLKMDERSVPDSEDGEDSAGGELIAWLSKEKAHCRIGVFTAYLTQVDVANKMRNPRVDFYLPKTAGLGVIERHILDAFENRALKLESETDQRRSGNTETKTLDPSEAIPSDELKNDTWQILTDTGAAVSHWTIKQPIQAGPQRTAGIRSVSGLLGFQLGEVRYRLVRTSKGRFAELSSPGLRVSGPPGSPALPVSIQRIALPEPLTGLEIEFAQDAEWTDLALPPHSEGILPIPSPSLEGQAANYIDGPAYHSQTRMLSISRDATMIDGVPCASVRLCPFQYEPRRHLFRVLQRGTLRIQGHSIPTLDGPEPESEPDPMSPLAHQVLGWPESAHDLGQPGANVAPPRFDGPPSPTQGYEGGSEGSSGRAEGSRKRRYLAVGTPESLAAIEPLLEQHRARFELLQPIIIAADAGCAADAPAAHKALWIRRQLDRRSVRLNETPHYVLLAGGDDTIPFYRYDHYKTDSAPAIPIPSDLWYAGWERDGAPAIPRYAIGRLPFDDPKPLRAYTERIAATPGSVAWRHWLFLCGEDPRGAYLNNVADIISKQAGHPSMSNCARGPAITKPVDAKRADALLSKGPSILTFRGHGLRGHWLLNHGQPWPDPTSGMAMEVGLNGIFSVACCTATPDRPEQHCGSCVYISSCSQYPAFGVQTMASGTAQWFMGSTRRSFTSANNDFHLALMDAICLNDAVTVGDAHRAALVELLADPGPLALDNAAMSVLLGDPAAPVGSWEQA